MVGPLPCTLLAKTSCGRLLSNDCEQVKLAQSYAEWNTRRAGVLLVLPHRLIKPEQIVYSASNVELLKLSCHLLARFPARNRLAVAKDSIGAFALDDGADENVEISWQCG